MRFMVIVKASEEAEIEIRQVFEPEDFGSEFEADKSREAANQEKI